jgi:hypothetical protein
MEVARLVCTSRLPGPERTLVVFDGPCGHFARPLTRRANRLVQSILSLLEAAIAAGPLVCYVDTSYARDLTTMLHHVSA